MSGILILEDGSTFKGYSFGKEISCAGEVVFNTGMVGYPESLTDPSYRGQILVLTYPLVGNYGVPSYSLNNNLPEHFESDRIQVKGFVISDYSERFSHWNAKKSLSQWLVEHNIPGLYDIDTRSLTKKLREKGVMLGKIIFDKDEVRDRSTENKIKHKIDFDDPNLHNLAKEVSIDKPQSYGGNQLSVISNQLSEELKTENRKLKTDIVLIDCGVKASIIKSLIKRGVSVLRVPWNYDITQIEFDGLLISNGPGDPKMCSDVVNSIKVAMMRNIPILGICLGNQLLALAAAADTYKLPYGHRGQNQPVIDMETGRCYITSQNHGYAVDEKTLPRNWEIWFQNANDETNEGIKHRTKPFFGVQFHPEATPGPEDTAFLFDMFVEKI